MKVIGPLMFAAACAMMAHALAEYVTHPHPVDFAILCGLAAGGLFGAMMMVEGES
jgi:Na+-translocating ferredoxin:NAD+ oxidoreductase RnfD subunit